MDDEPLGPCDRNFAEHTRHLFVEVAQARAIAGGARPARRAVFRKCHGVAHGRLELDPGRPDSLRHGIFAGDAYDVWARFSSDVRPTASDADNGTIGIGLKLFGVTGPTLAAHDPAAPTADLILQNHPVFFVDTGKDMCVFTDLSLQGKSEDWFERHPETKRILEEMTKFEASVLSATYWSVLPYACGVASAVKYRLLPEASGPSRAPEGDTNRLRTDLAARLKDEAVGFTLALQVPRPGWTPDLERATQDWPEQEAPFQPVGRVTFDVQDVATEGQESYGETLAFSPWRVPEANRPLGSIAESRRLTYPASMAQRYQVNGTPVAEPHRRRPPRLQLPLEDGGSNDG